jgi:hypothetical protein
VATEVPASPARALAPFAWILFYLVVIDVGLNVAFHYPRDPRNIKPSRIQQFFEYGRSVEGKFARMTRRTAEESAPIVASGWLEDNAAFVTPKSERHGGPVVSVYGMSHAGLLADDLAKCSPDLDVRFVGAPGAVASWAYSAFVADHRHARSAVSILALMTVGIPKVGTTTGSTMYFEFAYPYSYPRLRVENGVLRAEPPPIASAAAFREALLDESRARWNAYVDWIAANDKYYDPLLFKASFLDRSTFVRLLRRAYASSVGDRLERGVYDHRRGFDPQSEEAKVVQALVVDFARKARDDGSFPVIYIVNNLGTSDHAFRLLEPTLRANGIAYLSSHEICSPNDPRYYLPDSHFEPATNRRIAQAMADLIRPHLAAGAPPPAAPGAASD